MLKRICQDVNRFQDQCRCYIMCSNALKTNYLSIIILISLIILNITSLCSADDSPFELYPFNKSNGDAETPRIDDGGSDKIKLKRTFKFFGKNYTSVYVSKYIKVLFLISINVFCMYLLMPTSVLVLLLVNNIADTRVNEHVVTIRWCYS